MGFIKFLVRHLFAAGIAIVGGGMAVVGLASDTQSLFQLGLSSRVWAAAGAGIFMAAVIWMQYQLETRLGALLKATKGNEGGQILEPLQEKLLSIVVGYLKQFGEKKLIITRKNSGLYFDENNDRAAGIDLARDMYGLSGDSKRKELIELIESMPPEYMRLIPNMRWNGPLEVMVPEAGHRYLRLYKL